MGGKDDDDRSEFDRMMNDVDKDLANTRKELDRMVDELRGQLPSAHDAFEDLRAHRDNDNLHTTGTLARFKTFIDDNLALISDGFKRFPTNVRELKARMQEEREARQAEEVDIWRRWTGSRDSPDHIKMQIERASSEDKEKVEDATLALISQSLERNAHVPAYRVLDLYRDNESMFGSLDHFAAPMLSMGGACFYKPETVDNLPSTARWGWPTARPTWLSTEWFKRDPYSPIRLEAHPDLAPKGEKWRAAFEDLLCASLDKPMQTTEKIGVRPPEGKPQSTYHGPGLDWMLSLQCRGILPPQLPTLYRRVPKERVSGLVLAQMADYLHQHWAQYQFHYKADVKDLTEEVGTPAHGTAGCLVEAVQAPWQVPETEAELYEQMLPKLPAEASTQSIRGRKGEDWIGMASAMDSDVDRRDFLSAIKRVHQYEDRYGKSDMLFYSVTSGMTVDELEDVTASLLAENDYVMNDELLRLQHRTEDVRETMNLYARRAIAQREARGFSTEEAVVAVGLAGREALEAYDQRMQLALERAEQLGYDFEDWDWDKLPIEELERELEREAAYTAARRRDVLAKAARLGYDFNGWEYEGLPVQELEDELLRMEQYAKRDAAPAAKMEEVRRPDVLSQLTTTETVRMPDGTVTTKVVLRRRFADGTEEEKESVHTTNERAEAQAQAAEEARQIGNGRRDEKQRGKGWFWT